MSWWVEGEGKDQIAKNEEQEGNMKRKEEPAGSSWADDGPPSLYISLGMYTHSLDDEEEPRSSILRRPTFIAEILTPSSSDWYFVFWEGCEPRQCAVRMVL